MKIGEKIKEVLARFREGNRVSTPSQPPRATAMSGPRTAEVAGPLPVKSDSRHPATRHYRHRPD